MRTALSIAGSDSSGGAGVQADLKTMTMNGVFAMSAITALTAQNTTGVTGILEADPEFLKKQIDAVFEDIRPDAVKIGMVSSSGLIKTIAERLQHYKAENIVVDPVMVATSGSRLLEEDAVDTLKKELLPIATVITPNIPEAEILCGMEIHTEEDMVAAAKAIYEDLGCAVLLKGGHNINDANDLLYTKEEVSWFKGKESITQIHMEQDALFQVLSQQILPKVLTLRFLYSVQKTIFQEHWQICWILELEADQ